MRILAKTKDMSREEWLKIRSHSIGGSDVSVIAGINKFRSVYQLWLEKTGQTEPEEGQSENAHFGTVLEKIVRQEFMERTGLKVRQKNMILQSDEYPFMTANLDGVINDNGDKCIFEAKTASEYKKEVWENGVPPEYILQVQHYFAVLGKEYKRAYVAAIVGGNKFFYHIVERDETLISRIIALEKHFWENHVIGGVEPVPDGSEATTRYLNERYEDLGAQVELPDEVLSICEEYDNLSEQIKQLKSEKDAVANQIKTYLKDASVGIVGERKITWKAVVKNGLDIKRLKSEKPEIYEDYKTESQYRKFSVA